MADCPTPCRPMYNLYVAPCGCFKYLELAIRWTNRSCFDVISISKHILLVHLKADSKPKRKQSYCLLMYLQAKSGFSLYLFELVNLH